MIDPCNCENYRTMDGYWPDDEASVAFKCDQCREEIYVGDDYYDCDGDFLCEDCAREWLEKVLHDSRRTAVIGCD